MSYLSATLERDMTRPLFHLCPMPQHWRSRPNVQVVVTNRRRGSIALYGRPRSATPARPSLSLTDRGCVKTSRSP